MRLVYLANSRIPSGAANSIHVMRMCNAFAQIGHDVHLISPLQTTRSSGVFDVFSHYGVPNSFRIHHPSPVSLGVGKKRLYAAQMVQAAATLMPDLVYARSLPAALIAAAQGLPVCYELHHLPEQDHLLVAPVKRLRVYIEALRRKHWLGDQRLLELSQIGALDDPRLMFKRLVSSSNLVCAVTITHALKRAVLARYPELERRILVAPDGADPSPKDIPTTTLQGPQQKLTVGYTGQLYPGKGIELIANLAKMCPWATFHIIGGNGRELSYWRKKLRNDRNVYLYGSVPPKDVKGYIRAVDVCLLPNQRQMYAHSHKRRSGAEIGEFTSPLKLFEYMAEGKAIIASDLSVIKEILINNRNALIRPPDDTKQWSKALCLLKDDINLRKSLGHNAKVDFENNYTWENRARLILDPCTQNLSRYCDVKE